MENSLRKHFSPGQMAILDGKTWVRVVSQTPRRLYSFVERPDLWESKLEVATYRLEKPNDDLYEEIEVAKRKINWLVDGYFTNCLLMNDLGNITVERICELYNVELSHFRPLKK